MSAKSVKKTNQLSENMVLQASEDKFKFMFEHSSGAKSFTLSSGEVNVNPAFGAMLGYSREELSRKSWQEITYPEDIEPSQKAIEKLLSGQQDSVKFEKRYLHKSGAVVWGEVSTAMFRDSGSEQLYFMTEINNITARKQAEEALRSSHAQITRILENLQDAYFQADLFGNFTIVNTTAVSMYGYSSTEEMLGMPALALYAEKNDRELLLATLKSAGSVIDFSCKALHKDGSTFWVSMNVQFVRGEAGQIIGTEGVVRDITERKLVEEALKQSEEKFRLSFMTSQDAFYWATLEEGRLLEINPVFETVWGYSRAEVLGRTSLELGLYANPADRARLVAELNGNGFVRELELKGCKKDGTLITISLSASPMTFNRQNYILGVMRDITERQQAERKSREIRGILEEAEKIAHLGSWDWNFVTNEIYWSAELYQIFGRNPEAGPPAIQNYLDHYHPDDREKLQTAIESSMTGKKPEAFECRISRYDNGEERYLYAEGKVCFREKGYPERLIGCVQDITERKRAEADILDSLERERFLGNLIRDASVALGVGYPDGRLGMCNLAFQKLTGYSEAELKKIFWNSVLTPSEWLESEMQSLAELNRTKEPVVYEKEYLHKSGKRVPIELTVHPFFDAERNVTHYYAFITDITERKRAEAEIRALNAELEARVEARTRELRAAQEQLIQQEKLAVLGRLAGGVAHELRNPLGVISNAIYYLRMIQPNAEIDVKEYLGIITAEADNANQIISDLLDFSNPKMADREPVVVSDLIRETIKHFPVPENVQVRLDLPENLPKIYLDRHQITQVLGNLVVNACQAMGQGGELSVRSELREVKREQGVETDSLISHALLPASWLLVAVRDTGLGITHENMKKLFEPLFTTKPKGIGLGLAVSQKLIEANGGKIEVQSEIGKGSTFTVWLPVKQ